MVPYVRDQGAIRGTRPSSPARPTTVSGPAKMLLDGSDTDPNRWMPNAACQNADAELFYGQDRERPKDRETREAAAKAICAACRVKATCLRFALDTDQKFGIFGGLNEDERAAAQSAGMS